MIAMGVYSFEERYIRFVNADGCHVRTAQKRLTMRQVPSRAFLVLHRTSRLVVILTKLSHLQAVRALLGGGVLGEKDISCPQFSGRSILWVGFLYYSYVEIPWPTSDALIDTSWAFELKAKRPTAI